jgi:hypothetical protein
LKLRPFDETKPRSQLLNLFLAPSSPSIHVRICRKASTDDLLGCPYAIKERPIDQKANRLATHRLSAMVRQDCLELLPSGLLAIEALAICNMVANPDPLPNPDHFLEPIAKTKTRHCRNIIAGLIFCTTSTSSGR